MRLSAPPATNVLPSAEKATVNCSFSGCEKVSSRTPFTGSQSLIVRSALALASTLPSGRNDRPLMQPLWPFNVVFSLPVARSHSLILWS